MGTFKICVNSICDFDRWYNYINIRHVDVIVNSSFDKGGVFFSRELSFFDRFLGNKFPKFRDFVSKLAYVAPINLVLALE